jgi:hypothetical protein
MPKSISPQEQIESWFIRATPEETLTMAQRINLILRTRGALPGTGATPQILTDPQPKRGRPRKKKEPGPLVQAAAPANGDTE